MAKKTSVTHESKYRLTSKGFVTKNKTYRGIKNVFVTVGGVYRLAWGDVVVPDIPDTPDIPDIPDVPDIPDTPDVPDTHEHVWIKDEASSKEPTCTAMGTYFYYCSCGEQYHEDIPALGHSMMWANDIITPSCETKGEALYKCTRCGAEEVRYVPATGHDYKQGEVKEPTCEDRGYTAYQCQNCFHSYADYVAALGHKMEWAYNVEPTCTEFGKTVYECTRTGCDEVEIVYTDNPLGHAWVDDGNGVDPTCNSDGYANYTCSRCGETKTETLEANGQHSWRVSGSDGCVTYYQCSVCYANKSEGSHNFMEDGKCLDCGKQQ